MCREGSETRRRSRRIRSNARVFDFELTDADMQTLDALDRTSGAANARG
jgi:diketogulonate reductase-like aldo/keto reductase